MTRQDLEKQLIDHEGLRLKPYTCPAGKTTIGVGRNLDDLGISKQEAMEMLRHDILRVEMGLEKVVPGFLALSSRRRASLVDMCFNLGMTRFINFKNMLTAIAVGDFALAADEMLASRWAEQVGQRAHTLAAMMREG